MATLKLVLRTNKRKKDGTCPIALRITKDRKTRFVFTGQYVKEKDWDSELCRIRKSHPNSGRLNNFLSKKLGEANDFLLEADSGTNYVSSREIKNKVKRKSKNISFFTLANQRIKEYKEKGTYTVAIADESKIKSIEKFVDKGDLFFPDITVPFLEKFKVYCASV